MKNAKTNRAASALELVLPATSANLGPAFDAAALAFAMFLKVRAQSAANFPSRRVVATRKSAAGSKTISS